MAETETKLTCECGNVTLSVFGNPIINAECLCSDCQKAGKIIQTLDGAPKVLNHDSATRFALYRKDRIQLHSGRQELSEHCLEKDSTTRRIIATCCNTPIFLDLSGGHWLSIYGLLWPKDQLPALDIRTMTRSRPDGVDLPNDVPNPKTHTLSFYFILLKAWAMMGFRTPELDFLPEKIDGE